MVKSCCQPVMTILVGCVLTACQPTPSTQEIDNLAEIQKPEPSHPSEVKPQTSHHLHIASVPNLEIALPIIVNQFQQTYPNINVTYSFANAEHIYHEVQENDRRYDIVLSDNQSMPYQLFQEHQLQYHTINQHDHDEKDNDDDDDTDEKDETQAHTEPVLFTYARGQLVIYSEKYNMSIDPTVIFDENLLENKPFSVAVGNMENLSYGIATKAWLINQNLYPNIADHLIELDNFSDMIDMVYQKQADFSITSLAQVLNDSKQLTIKNLSNKTSTYTVLPKNSYPAILQDGIILQPSDASEQFVDYLQSSKAQEILNEAGFLPICNKSSLLPACKNS